MKSKHVVLTPEQQERAQKFMLDKGLNNRMIAEKAGVHERTVGRLFGTPSGRPESARGVPFTQATVLCRHAGLDLDSLLSDSESIEDNLWERAGELDAGLMRRIRRAVDLDAQDIQILHRDHARSQGSQVAAILGDMPRGFREVNRTKSVVDGPDDLTIQISDGLAETDFRTSSGAGFLVKLPQLVWPCSCQANGHRDPKCDVHQDAAIGDEVASLFKSGIVRFNYRGVDLRYRWSPGTWPPNADSVFLVDRVVEDIRKRGSSVTKVLDVGCGSGFLALQLGNRLPTTTRLDMTDWLFQPLLLSHANAQSLITNPRKSVRILCTMFVPRPGIDGFDHRYDVLICNPPYLPLPDMEFGVLGTNAVAGTHLLCDVVQNGLEIADTVYFGASSLATPELQLAATGKKLNAIAGPLELPFRVPYVLDREHLVHHLQRRGLTEDRRRKYRYFHEFTVYRLQR